MCTCSKQNDTRCRDGVTVLWCQSHLVWLVFESSISMWVFFFIQKTFLCLFPACFVFIGMVREERWEGRLRERCAVCKVQKYRTLLFTKNKGSSYIQSFKLKLKSKKQTSLSTGFRSSSKAS